eukprot:6352045-Lingulodinium_polyedra.AAC.1
MKCWAAQTASAANALASPSSQHRSMKSDMASSSPIGVSGRPMRRCAVASKNASIAALYLLR